MTGVLLAIPLADFAVLPTACSVAHFHNVIIGGVLFGGLRGLHLLFPKAFGFSPTSARGPFVLADRLLSRLMPPALGLLATRRMQHYDNVAPQPFGWWRWWARW
jgi:heme/copper-type cytochrome/quinol oxidase subunit 1